MDDSYNSYSRKQLDDLFLKMIAYYGGDPKRIQHFVKVHSFARIIAIGEQMDEGSLFILEAAALRMISESNLRKKSMVNVTESFRNRKDRSLPRRCSQNLVLKII